VELIEFCPPVFQIRVRARDGGVPFRFNTSVVIVTMQRNFQTPTWRVPSYSQTVVESLGLGTVILTVNATDTDPLVSYILVPLKKKNMVNTYLLVT
jgi:hypothetical protein